MTHIGGYPGRYPAKIKETLLRFKPDLFICGHSHILKVMYDQKFKLLHLNPGAAGKHGWHKVRTLLKFTISDKKIANLVVIEIAEK
jgi:predicted phosphodiesterase